MSLVTAHLQYSLICLGYDETKGSPIFQFVVHHLPLGPLPYEFPEDAGFFLVNGFQGTGEVLRPQLRFLDPEEQVLFEQQVELQPQESGVPGPMLSVVYVTGLIFRLAGDYHVEVWLEDRRLTRYPLWVEELELA